MSPMAEIYGVSFYGDQIEVTVTKNAAVFNDWINSHRRRLHKLLVGLDIEWLPCFNPEENHPVALLQLCVGRRCLLFQLLHKDAVPRFLVDFLMDPNFKFVGIGVKGDAEKLLRDHKRMVANTVDLNQLALSVYGEEVYGKMGLKRMAKEVLGKVMEKPLNVTLSKWDAEELVYEQIEYAAIDAFVSFEIGKNLFNSIWERQREIEIPRRAVVKRENLNCHYQLQFSSSVSVLTLLFQLIKLDLRGSPSLQAEVKTEKLDAERMSDKGKYSGKDAVVDERGI
ncbi:hypothetical protein T459_07717 [Capsicum annuum]|uniref:3'-5' exonuclease domain-containing protein n=1 Tax=Capsicum annuum TaxID=4072 RepID=A0A2G2ZUI0_CAPAN|nr:hypothetical protein T459_07717 [Capsicum annuum]